MIKSSTWIFTKQILESALILGIAKRSFLFYERKKDKERDRKLYYITRKCSGRKV